MIVGSHVLGWGVNHPAEVLTNVDLEETLDTTDTWIKERTGIEERRVGGTTSTMGIAAGAAALSRWGGDPTEVGAIILATSTPDATMPPTAAAVAEAIGVTGGVMDLNGACAGFVQGLILAHGLIATGCAPVLVVGADAMSRITDPSDRTTAVLFGDGGAALLLGAASATGGGLLGSDLGSDPAAQGILSCATDGTIHMDGPAVYKIAVRAAVTSIESALADAGIDAAAVDLFVPHQANQRITDAIARRLHWDDERVVSTIARTANTSAATVPTALAVAAESGRLVEGSIVVTTGFGAGMTWATTVSRWATT